MNNDDFKEVPDNIQDNNEETTNNIDNTNDNKSNDYEDVCYICRRPESVAGKMIHIQPNLCICNDCMQKTFDSMSNGNFGNFGNLGNISNMDFGNMPNISMINLSDLTGGIPNSQKLKKKKPKEEKKVEPILDIHSIPAPHRIKASLDDYVVGQSMQRRSCRLQYITTTSVSWLTISIRRRKRIPLQSRLQINMMVWRLRNQICS